MKLPDLEGNTVQLADFRGEKTLVLFWNPGCGFCHQNAPRPQRVGGGSHRGRPEARGGLGGLREANREMGISSPVLLDQNFATGRARGLLGRPLRCWWMHRARWLPILPWSSCGHGACWSRPDDDVNLQGPRLLA